MNSNVSLLIGKLNSYLVNGSYIAENEIDLAIYYAKLYPNEEISRILVKNLNQLINKRMEEVNRFNEILLNFNYFPNERTLLLYRYFPFKSGNIEVEKYLFSLLFNNPDINKYLDNLLLAFTSINNENYRKISNLLRTFIYDENLRYDNFKNNSRLFGINKYPSEDEIVSNFRNLANEKDNPSRNLAIGFYAELVALKDELNYLNNNNRPDLGDKVIWTSRDIGDGFGYDILSYNPINLHEKLIEVKGTMSLTNDINVSYNEYRLFNNIVFPKYDYHTEIKEDYIFKIVYFDEQFNPHIFDITGKKIADNEIIYD